MSQYLSRSTSRVRRVIFAGLALILLAVSAFQLQPSMPANAALPANGSAAVADVSAASTGSNTPFDCSQISVYHIDQQMNMHAAELMAACGQAKSGTAPAKANIGGSAVGRVHPNAYGGVDVNVMVPEPYAYPSVTQSETFVWGHGNTIVVNSNASPGSSGCYSGLAYSTNGGTTFTRLVPNPLCSGHGTNYGDPTVVFDVAHNIWVASDLATGCGGQGIGIWTSPDGITWTAGPCAISTSQGDRQSTYVDNNPASPNYGTMFISFADYNLAGPPISVVRSTDGGATWSARINLALPSGISFLRNVQDTGGPNGTFYIAAMNENSGALNPRSNYMYRSTNGGVTWSAAIQVTAPFPAPGVTTSGYFALFFPTIWRYEGWGQPGAGPGGVVHYAFTEHGAGSDPGDVYYTRSSDDGLTWSTPLKMNTDTTTNGNWQPSLAVTTGGAVLVSWYDARGAASASCGSPGANTPCYQRFGRVSLDNGVTWQSDQSISDVVSPLPAQPDSAVQAVYEGDYDYSSADGTNAYTTWNDGRNIISSNSQQDVYFDKVSLIQGTATPTPTGTLPTATTTRTFTQTPTSTATPSPTATPNPCLVYAIATGTGTIVPGTTNVGSACDDCSTTITLPFPVTLYNQTYTTASVSSNGQLNFGAADSAFTNTCLPDAATTYTIFPYWDDQRTDTAGSGIFTAQVGTTFYIEWRTTLFTGGTPENYEIVLTQGSPNFQVVYGSAITDTASETIGVQDGGTNPFTQYKCSTASPPITAGLQLSFSVNCGTPSVTPTGNIPTATRTGTTGPTSTVTVTQTSGTASTNTATATQTSAPTNTSTATVVAGSTSTATTVPANTSTATVVAANTSTATSVPSVTRTVVATETPCTIQFSDVQDQTAYYYQGVYYLACRGVVSGYSDGTFKPFNNTTRAQMTKIVTLAFNLALVTPPATGTFADVDSSSVFYQLIETAAARGLVSGYTCGGINPQTGAAEPCTTGNRPYFRPSNFVTRGQLAKIVVLGAAFPLINPPTPTFTDVPRTDVFYQSIETAVCHGIISGYSDNTYRSNNYAFRGQIAKIVYLAVTNPQGTCPAATPLAR